MNSHENLKIIAAGGGAPNKSSAPALTEAIEMSGARKPRVLIIPTAKVTAEAYNTSVRSANDLFSTQLGLDTAVLHDFDTDPTNEQIAHEIGGADVVYISGGDTLRMMEAWAKNGVARTLGKSAIEGSLVLSGISAGAIAPFRWGHSDSLSFRPQHADDWEYIAVPGLDLIPAAITPHYNSSNERLGSRASSFERLFGQEAANRGTYTGLGIDNFAAVKVEGGKITPMYTKADNRVSLLRLDRQGNLSSQVMATSDAIIIAEL